MVAARPNELFVLSQMAQAGASKILDYGCGDGGLVVLGLEAGYDCWGVEKYYDDRHDFKSVSEARTPEAAKPRVRLLTDEGRIPFPDAEFDFVCSNMVIEHVHDLELVVREIARVTKPGGVGVHVFPTTETVAEGHVGVPYYHRVPKILRRAWSYPWYRTHVAYRMHPSHETFAGWCQSLGVFFEESVVLRRSADVDLAFSKYFEVTHIEDVKLSFHRGKEFPRRPLLRWIELRRVGSALLLRRR